MTRDSYTAVVSGANRGIGFAVAHGLAREGLRVVIASRSEAEGRSAASALREEGFEVHSHALDVTDDASVRALAAFTQRAFGTVDVLVNNAGVFLDEFDPRIGTTSNLEFERLRASMETNAYGALRMCQAYVPAMRGQGYGRVVNVSSILAQSAGIGPGWPAYRASKSALNVITRVLAAEHRGTNVLVNAVCPGRVRTRMGGDDAPLSVEEGADTAVWLATRPDGSPTGEFFHARTSIPW